MDLTWRWPFSRTQNPAAGTEYQHLRTHLLTLPIHATITTPVRRSLQLGLLLTLLAISAAAGELAHLRNGFSIRHDRHEVIGDKTRLYIGQGFVEVPTAEIVDFEPDDTPETPMPPPASRPESRSDVVEGPVVPAKSIQDHVSDASKTTGIDPDFINSVIHHESGFNPNAVSKKGARGLMQLMPDTAGKLGVSNSFDPAQNVQGGAAYLRQLLELYHGDAVKALAAYNAGPQRVEQYKGVPPYHETQAYIARIIREYNQKKLAEQKAAREAVAAKRSTTSKKSVSNKPAKVSAKPSSASQPGS